VLKQVKKLLKKSIAFNNSFFAATNGGILQSADNGFSWQARGIKPIVQSDHIVVTFCFGEGLI